MQDTYYYQGKGWVYAEERAWNSWRSKSQKIQGCCWHLLAVFFPLQLYQLAMVFAIILGHPLHEADRDDSILFE